MQGWGVRGAAEQDRCRPRVQHAGRVRAGGARGPGALERSGAVRRSEAAMSRRVAIPDLISPSYFPAIAAVELGCCKREGIDATLELLFPVTRTYEELREGRLDFVGGASHAALYAFKDWQGGKLLCALAQHMYWFLILGKSLGVNKGELSEIGRAHV